MSRADLLFVPVILLLLLVSFQQFLSFLSLIRVRRFRYRVHRTNITLHTLRAFLATVLLAVCYTACQEYALTVTDFAILYLSYTALLLAVLAPLVQREGYRPLHGIARIPFSLSGGVHATTEAILLFLLLGTRLLRFNDEPIYLINLLRVTEPSLVSIAVCVLGALLALLSLVLMTPYCLTVTSAAHRHIGSHKVAVVAQSLRRVLADFLFSLAAFALPGATLTPLAYVYLILSFLLHAFTILCIPFQSLTDFIRRRGDEKEQRALSERTPDTQDGTLTVTPEALEQLLAAHALLCAGQMTEDEFAAKKRELLGF